MNNNNQVSTSAVAGTQLVNHSPSTSRPVLKLALDVHLAEHVVGMQYDGSSPKPPQRFKPQALLDWVKKQLAQGWRVVSCYEAGPFGYVLHRQLTALGVTNYVIRPRNWDEQHKRIKTDRTDALAMLAALDRYVAGNPRALALVRVPTEAEERARTQSRVRQGLRRDLKMIVQRGRGVALQHGYALKGHWYGPRKWKRLPIPQWLAELLLPLRTAALALKEQVRLETGKVEAASTRAKPKGMGSLTEQILEREVGDWGRFKNRRQISSYLGLCPGENSSGSRRQQGSITKCGNPRLRCALCELAWRLLRYQPQYRLCRKWRRDLLSRRTSGGRKKQLIVALARGFGVDWWRIRTGQTHPDKLGLLMVNPQPQG